MVDIVVGAAGSGLPHIMKVDPDKILQLKQGLEEECERLREWLRKNENDLINIGPPGNDPCSIDTMFFMSQKGREAVNATRVYIDRLDSIARQLHESAVSYGLTEDDAASRFRQGPP